MDSQTVESALTTAVKHHQTGRLPEAAAIYRQVLAVDPDQADANHLLGVIAFQEERFTDAVDLIGKARNLAPKEANFNINLARALAQLGKLIDAAEAFWAGGEFATAETTCRQAIEHEPENYLSHLMLSYILADLDRPREAEAALYKAFDLMPKIYGPDFRRDGKPHATPPSQRSPFTYVIDIVGTCNLRCPSCPVGNLAQADRPKGFMEIGLYEEIIAKIKKESPDATPKLWLFNWGEPTLHPKLPEFISIAKSRGLPVMLSSNLNTKLDLKEVIRAAPDEIKISLSGFSQEIYGKTHARGKIDLVKENMKKIHDYIDEFGVSINVWVSYHLYRHNVVDTIPMAEFAQSLGFGFNPIPAFYQPLEKILELITNGSPDDEKDLVDNLFFHPLQRVIMSRPHRSNDLDCEIRANMTTINYDGSVALCCGVYNEENMLGVNFTDLPHEELQARKYEHEFCKTCYGYGLQFQSARVEDEKPIGARRLAHIERAIAAADER